MQPLDNFPPRSLHCTVRLCQPVSQVLEHVNQEPVTHWGSGVGVVIAISMGGAGTKTVGAKEDVVLRVVFIKVESVVALCAVVGLGLGMSGTGG